MSEVTLLTTLYEIPDDFNAEAYFHDSYGIVFDEGEVKRVALRTDSRQAKYFRSVPLHHSQQGGHTRQLLDILFQNKAHPRLRAGDTVIWSESDCTVSARTTAIMVDSLKKTLDTYADTSLFPEP